MAKLYFKKKLIQFALEGTYNVDAIAAGATPIPVYAKNVTFTPGQGETEQSEYDKPYFGNDPIIALERLASLSFEVELPATGTAGTASPLNTMLQLAWMDMVEDPGGTPPTVSHHLIEQSPSTATVYFRIDSERHALTGVTGKVTFRFERKKKPVAVFELSGYHLDPVKEALPTADFSAWKAGIVVSKTNTPTMVFDSFSPCVSMIEIAVGPEAVRRDIINCESLGLSDRKVTGKMVMDATELDVKDMWAVARQEVGKSLNLVHGTSAGGQWEIQCPNVQPLEPKPSEDSNIYTYDVELNIMPNTGNDDIVIIAK